MLACLTGSRQLDDPAVSSSFYSLSVRRADDLTVKLCRLLAILRVFPGGEGVATTAPPKHNAA